MRRRWVNNEKHRDECVAHSRVRVVRVPAFCHRCRPWLLLLSFLCWLFSSFNVCLTLASFPLTVAVPGWYLRWVFMSQLASIYWWFANVFFPPLSGLLISSPMHTAASWTSKWPHHVLPQVQPLPVFMTQWLVPLPTQSLRPGFLLVAHESPCSWDPSPSPLLPSEFTLSPPFACVTFSHFLIILLNCLLTSKLLPSWSLCNADLIIWPYVSFSMAYLAFEVRFKCFCQASRSSPPLLPELSLLSAELLTFPSVHLLLLCSCHCLKWPPALL